MSSGWLNAKGPEGAQLKISGIPFNAVRPPPAAHHWDHQLGAALLKWATTAQCCNSHEWFSFNWQPKGLKCYTNEQQRLLNDGITMQTINGSSRFLVSSLGAPKWGITIESQAQMSLNYIIMINSILLGGGRSTEIILHTYLSQYYNRNVILKSSASAKSYSSKSIISMWFKYQK